MTTINCPRCGHPINEHTDRLARNEYNCDLTPQDIAERALEQAGLLTDTHGRTWRAFEREDGSVSIYYTRGNEQVHFVVWDSLNYPYDPSPAAQTALAYGDADLSKGSTKEWFDGIEEIPF